jgi:CBS domain-containing protein
VDVREAARIMHERDIGALPVVALDMLARLAVDATDVAELEVNLLAGPDGLVAVDARARME